MTGAPPTIPGLIQDHVLDAELGALLWLLAAGGLPIHLVAPEPADADGIRAALAPLASDPASVTTGRGAGVEDVLKLPVPLRPGTGAVVVLHGGRVAAAHLLRPPLRDAGGHVRPQGPAVLAAWDDREGRWEHFAWAIAPEIGDAIGRPAGDIEIEQRRRREFVEALAAGGLDPEQVGTALAGYGAATRLQ